MPFVRAFRHPSLAITTAVAVLAIVAAVVVRFWERALFDSTTSVGPVRYSTRPVTFDSFETINLVSAVGLAAIVVALVALVAGTVLLFRILRAD